MFKVLIPAASLLSLVAFAAQGRSEAPSVEEMPLLPPAAMGWHLSHEGEMAKLAYGIANSDQLVIMLTCSPGDARAESYGVVTPVGVSAGEGPSASDPLGAMAPTVVNLDSPSMAALRREGALPVVGDAGQAALPVTSTDRDAVEGFFAHCGATRG